jgi:hypothetical protein
MTHLYRALVATIASHCDLHDATFLDAVCPACAQGVPPVEAS